MRKQRQTWVQVFTVSWFPVGAKHVSTIHCLDRATANGLAEKMAPDFAGYPDHDPKIRVEREELRATVLTDGLLQLMLPQ